MKVVGGVPRCSGFAVCFSQRSVLTRLKSRLHFAKPSESQGSRSRFHSRCARKAAMQKVAVLARTAGEIDETASLIGGESGGSLSLPRELIGLPTIERVLDRPACE